jgi:hypothetical protein
VEEAFDLPKGTVGIVGANMRQSRKTQGVKCKGVSPYSSRLTTNDILVFQSCGRDSNGTEKVQRG